MQSLHNVTRAMAACMHDVGIAHQSHGAQQRLQRLLSEQQAQQKHLEAWFEADTAAWHASFSKVLFCRLRLREREGPKTQNPKPKTQTLLLCSLPRTGLYQ